MKVSIDEIRIKEGRRSLDTDHVKELTDSICELGLLNPITIDSENTLIAGLHRLEAARRLGWKEVECSVSSLDGLQAELAEIDENFVRSGCPLWNTARCFCAARRFMKCCTRKQRQPMTAGLSAATSIRMGWATKCRTPQSHLCRTRRTSSA